VYKNLNADCFSVCDADTRLLLMHASRLALKDAEFVVRPKGRERVLRNRRKNIHAGVLGELALLSQAPQTPRRVKYNPYKAAHFKDQFRRKVTRSPFVLFEEGQVFAA
jgi:hypothetical protein